MYDCYKFHKNIDKILNDSGIKCNFHIEKQTNIKSPEFIAITCLFQMTQPYRKFSIYVNNIHTSCLANANNPIIIRIYYDKSVTNITKFNQYKNVELIRYDFPDVLSKNKLLDAKNSESRHVPGNITVHPGTFGTLMRFLALFNFLNNATVCHGFDADMLLNYREIKKCIGIMSKYNSPYYALYYDGFNLNNDIKRVGTNVFGDYIMASYIANSKKLNLSYAVLTDFLKDAIRHSTQITKWANVNNCYRNNVTLDTVFKYGIDEFFANSYLLPVIHGHHNVIGTRLYINVRNIHYELYRAIKQNQIDTIHCNYLLSELKLIFKNILHSEDNLHKYIISIDVAMTKTLEIFKSLNNNINIYKKYIDLLIKIKSKKIIQFNSEQSEYLDFNAKTEFVDNIYILHCANSNPTVSKKIDGLAIMTEIAANSLIILPYGNLYKEEKRNWQLSKIIEHFGKLGNHIPILVAEQIYPTKKFNKGQLYNIAVDWYITHKVKDANPRNSNLRIILHDIDMIPDRILYSKYLDPDLAMPIQLLPTNDDFRKLYHSNVSIPLGGAITAISLADYIKINGFPNDCLGWSGEDNMFHFRLKINDIYRNYNTEGNITNTDMQRINNKNKQTYIQEKNLRSENVWKKMEVDKTNWANNGFSQLNNLNYTVQLANTDHYKVDQNIIHIKVKLDSTITGGSRKILIVVPFANFKSEENRSTQLDQFIAHISLLIKQTKSNVCVVIAEQQLPQVYFNRGQLLNAGVKWYIDQYGEPNFVILHDVDMLPDQILFSEYLKAKKQISLVPQDKEYKEKYGRIILSAGGGIFGLPFSEYVEANGYPNTLWGWGGEDDAFSKRLANIYKTKITYIRIGHISHIDTQRKSHQSKMQYLRQNKLRSMMVHENLADDKVNWKSNGYGNVRAKTVSHDQISGICAFKVKFNLDDTYLAETITHNDQVYKELGGAKLL